MMENNAALSLTVQGCRLLAKEVTNLKTGLEKLETGSQST